jgi:Erv1 / Alr family
MPCENHGSKCNGKECANTNVDNGLMTRLWGPSGWLFLHCVTFGYPYKIDPTNPEHLAKQNDYYRFFYYLGKVLPCKYCRNSYDEFFANHSPMRQLGSREELSKWLYDVHNLVNDKLGVPACERPSFEEIKTRYESFRAACKPLTEKERNDKAGKGCIAPASGKPKRSVIKVVEYDQATPKPTALQEFPKSDDYIVLSKTTAMLLVLALLVVLLGGWYWLSEAAKRK